MKNNINLAQWIEQQGLPKVIGAERFIIGQDLTPHEASCVRRMLKRAYLDSQGLIILADHVEFGFPDNLPFLARFLRLILAGCDDSNEDKWKDPLVDTLTACDCNVMRNILDRNK